MAPAAPAITIELAGIPRSEPDIVPCLRFLRIFPNAKAKFIIALDV